MEKDLEHTALKVPPPLVFLAYLAGALVLNWILPFPEPWAGILRIVGGAGVLTGFVLGATAIAAMMRAHTSPDPHRPTTRLVTEGPYRFTRNPIYLGFLLISVGFTLVAGTLWGFLLSPVLIWAVTAIVIRAEEGYLATRFGGVYRAHMDRARRWI